MNDITDITYIHNTIDMVHVTDKTDTADRGTGCRGSGSGTDDRYALGFGLEPGLAGVLARLQHL